MNSFEIKRMYEKKMDATFVKKLNIPHNGKFSAFFATFENKVSAFSKSTEDTYVSKPQFKCARINRANWFSNEGKGCWCNQVDRIVMSCCCGVHIPIFNSVNKYKLS